MTGPAYRRHKLKKGFQVVKLVDLSKINWLMARAGDKNLWVFSPRNKQTHRQPKYFREVKLINWITHQHPNIPITCVLTEKMSKMEIDIKKKRLKRLFLIKSMTCSCFFWWQIFLTDQCGLENPSISNRTQRLIGGSHPCLSILFFNYHIVKALSRLWFRFFRTQANKKPSTRLCSHG
jgi:hypothetical protein